MNSPTAMSTEVQEFLAREHGLLIGGEWCQALSGTQMETTNPADENSLAHVASGEAEDIDRAVSAARAALTGPWSRINTHERTRLLWGLADKIEARLPLLAELEMLDNGMPIGVAQYSIARFGAGLLRYYSGWATKAFGDVIPVSPQEVENGASLTYTRREPIGVVGAIIPWNSPFIMAILKLAPALTCGCTVVLKPAEQTPLSALVLGELVREAGIPDGVVNIVNGYGETAGAALAAHDDVDKIAFTGSTEVGRKIIRASAGNMKRVTLELGGKSPVVVFPDADLNSVIPGACQAAYFLQGQNCMAGTRLFVHEDVYEKVITGVSAAASAFKLGPGSDPESELGPLISGEQRERVLGYVESGKAAGARLECGGETVFDRGFFMRPALFSGVSGDMQIAREEIFGPVLCAQSFGDSDLEEIAAQANDSIYGLSGSVWTRDISVAHRMAALIDSGQVSINCHAAVDPAIPFGGNKQSGWGREFGREGLEAYLKTKATTVIF